VTASPPLAALAHPFLPADPSVAGAVVEAATAPLCRPALPADADVVVWGRLAGDALRAPARELDLLALRAAVPRRLRIRGVHRLPAPGAASGLRGWARGAARAGVLVELASARAGPRILDAVLDAAGAAAQAGRLQVGAGGSLLLRVRTPGGDAVLRVARAGAPGDPARAARALERLAGAGSAPRLLGRGVVAGASWSAEEALAGRRPAVVGDELLGQVAAACACLPRRDTLPTAPLDDLLAAAALLPRHAVALRRLADAVRPRLDGVPAIQRHGDLWAGNLLVGGGGLRGIVDWDAAHPRGVPGADLVQLAGTHARRRAHLPLGRAVTERPWRAGDLAAATAGYWRALDIAPDGALLDLAGIAWWAAEIHHTLLRFPQRAADGRWAAENVGAALPALTRLAEAPSGRSRAGARGSTRPAATRG
jgi:hypothetical protein